jgi:hypothetical protein
MSSIRDQIRAQVFSAESSKIKSEVVEFFGAKIEIRQSTLGQTISAQNDEDRESAIIDLLVKNAYVPNTDIRVFEDTDAEQFKLMPFGADFIRVSKTMEILTGIDFREVADKAKEGQPDKVGNEVSVGAEEV